MNLSILELKKFIEEELSEVKKYQYDARRYATEGLQEEDVRDDGTEWIKLRRSAFERLLKLCHPSSSQDDLK